MAQTQTTTVKDTGEILDRINTRLAWLSAVSQLISSQAELSEVLSSGYLSKEEWGNVGWLQTCLLKEIAEGIDAISDARMKSGRKEGVE